MNFDKDLDARGLNCPLPILRAKKALTDMQKRPGAAHCFDRPGFGQGFPGVLQADRQRASGEFGSQQRIYFLPEAKVNRAAAATEPKGCLPRAAVSVCVDSSAIGCVIGRLFGLRLADTIS